MKKVLVILGSTRQNRAGEKVANWVMKTLPKSDDLSYELVDLRDWQLPFFDEPISPAYAGGNYVNPVAKKWAEKVASADGFLIVTPEYNHGYPAVLKNALDYVYSEWNGKPVTFVSYGAYAGGVRAVEQLRQVAVELQMIPLREEVNIHIVWEAFNDDGSIKNEHLVSRLDTIHQQFAKWFAL